MYHTITTNIMVENVKETVLFYQEKLNFEKVVTVPEEGEVLDFAIIKKDHISIMFQAKNSIIEEYPSLDTKQIKPTFTLFINVSDIENLYQELKTK